MKAVEAGSGASCGKGLVDFALQANMLPGFELKIAPGLIDIEIVGQGAFNIVRVSVVPLDQVRVVAVHDAHEVCQISESWGAVAAQATRGRRQFDQ